MYKSEKYQLYMLNLFSYLSYFFYFCLFIGVATTKPEYLDELQLCVQIYISLFLIYRFNPFIKRSNKYDELDRKVAFSSGTFLLLTSSIAGIAKVYLEDAAKKIRTNIKATINSR